MILNSSFEYIVFLIVFSYGILMGVCWSVLQFVPTFFKKKLWAKNVVDFFGALLFGALFFVSINYHNFGEFRLYLFVSFCLGFCLQRKTLGKPFAKLFALVYNKIIIALAKFKTSKCGKVLFK